MKTQFLFIYKNIYVCVCIHIKPSPRPAACSHFPSTPPPPFPNKKAPESRDVLEERTGAAPIAYIS